MSSNPKSPFTDRVRVMGLVYAKAGMNNEQFYERWIQHGHLIRSLSSFSKHILRYEQCHILDGSPILPQVPDADLAGVRGYATMEVAKIEDMHEFFASEEYQTIGVEDEKQFLDRDLSMSQVFISRVLPMYEKGTTGII